MASSSTTPMRATHHRRSSTSTSLQFSFSPSLSPPAVSNDTTRHRAFSDSSQLVLGDDEDVGPDVGSSTSSYRLQTPSSPGWTWNGEGGSGTGAGARGASKAANVLSETPLVASPVSSPLSSLAIHGGEGEPSIVSSSLPPLTPDLEVGVPGPTAEAGPATIRTRPRAATELSPIVPLDPTRSTNRNRSLSLSTILRQKLQRTNTNDKPGWRQLVKRDSSSKLVSRDVSGASSTVSLVGTGQLTPPANSKKRPGFKSITSSTFHLNKGLKSNISLTLPRSSSSVAVSAVPAKAPVDYFGLMLPKELQVLILKTLLAIWKADRDDGRWSGEVGGRRELIKLSRVSKYWEELVFDGQLWPDLHLTPFVHFLAPGTLGRMLSHSSPFIRTLDIHGLKNLQGSRLTAVLSSHVPFRFTSIDLRGCRKLGTGAINDLLTQSPEVRHLNLKGVLSVEPSTLQVIARSLHVLESLNLSRCFNISFGDLVQFLETVEERGSSQITELRIAGLKGYGPTADSLLPRIATALPDLQVLDLQGSPHVFDASFKAFVTALSDNGAVCKIKHLNVSSCPQLTDKALLHLAPHLANLEILELAGYGDRLQNAGLVAVIKQAAHLQRLDLDSATSITDLVTDALAARVQIDGEEYPSMLKTLILSFAKGLTAEGLIRLIKGCPALAELELDNTEANGAVMEEFLKRRLTATSLSLIDCRAVTTASQMDVGKRYSARTRSGWPGYEARPFAYTAEERRHASPVLKTFHSWKEVQPPESWIETLTDKLPDVVDIQIERRNNLKGRSWARGQPRAADFDEGMSCLVM